MRNYAGAGTFHASRHIPPIICIKFAFLSPLRNGTSISSGARRRTDVVQIDLAVVQLERLLEVEARHLPGGVVLLG
ncbi:hypothetical protein LBX01_03850 [Altererythrobacter sp. N1]|nr:hypothetical protein LBX01_03850 [Altererythrobacter sp. N1]